MADRFRDPSEEPAPGSFEGKVVSYTPEEAAKMQGQRDAEESAFGDIADEGEGAEPLDLDALSVEELDEIIKNT